MIIKRRAPTAGFTIVRNQCIRDHTLSYRARGVLIYLLSQPVDWETSSARLALEGGEGRDAVRTALRELIAVGYVRLDKRQDSRGHWASIYTVGDSAWANHRPVDNAGNRLKSPVDNSHEPTKTPCG